MHRSGGQVVWYKNIETLVYSRRVIILLQEISWKPQKSPLGTTISLHSPYFVWDQRTLSNEIPEIVGRLEKITQFHGITI